MQQLLQYWPQIAGIALLAYAGYRRFGSQNISLGNIINAPAVTSTKLSALKALIGQLDPKKDKAKIEYLVNNFGQDFVSEYLSK